MTTYSKAKLYFLRIYGNSFNKGCIKNYKILFCQQKVKRINFSQLVFKRIEETSTNIFTPFDKINNKENYLTLLNNNKNYHKCSGKNFSASPQSSLKNVVKLINFEYNENIMKIEVDPRLLVQKKSSENLKFKEIFINNPNKIENEEDNKISKNFQTDFQSRIDVELKKEEDESKLEGEKQHQTSRIKLKLDFKMVSRSRDNKK